MTMSDAYDFKDILSDLGDPTTSNPSQAVRHAICARTAQRSVTPNLKVTPKTTYGGSGIPFLVSKSIMMHTRLQRRCEFAANIVPGAASRLRHGSSAYRASPPSPRAPPSDFQGSHRRGNGPCVPASVHASEDARRAAGCPERTTEVTEHGGLAFRGDALDLWLACL